MDSIGYGIVDGGNHVFIKACVAFFFAYAWNGPTNFVNGEVDEWCTARGDATSEPTKGRGILNPLPSNG